MSPPSPPLANDEPELRRVSVMFADIQGSTAMIQHMTAEAAAGLIDPALRIMVDAVERYGGVVSNRGDGIMAIFGAPSSAEDHALRACLAALAIRDRLAAHESATNDHNHVKARIGIHVGDVVFRPVRLRGGWSQDAVGITVHIAARLEQSAEPGTIVLSDAAWKLARGFVHAAPLDPIAVKGVDVPILRLRLLQADPTANRWGVRAANGLAGFVGRSGELATLDQALAAAGEGLQLAQIVGAAGLGKSRLLHEFLGGATARGCHTITLIGDYHRRFMPFQPIAAWLRQWLGIGAGEAGPVARAKLQAGVAALEGAGAIDIDLLDRLLGLGDAAPEIASLDAGSLDARREVDLGETFATLLRAIAAGRRCILVCEDVDAFDAASRDVLLSALGHLAAEPLLVVTTSRSRVRLPVVRPRATRRLVLEPLSDEEAADLLANIDRKLADNAALAATILRKAGGNPLFLEEVAPLVAQQDGAMPTALDDAALPEIPDQVGTLITDRLRRLPPPLQRLMKLCSVIGSDIPVAQASTLTGTPQEVLYPQLLKLQSEKLLYETRKFPDPQFSFTHALTRDAVYGQILAAERRKYHARLVEILEADGPQARVRHLDDLCVHAIKAQAWSKAAPYLHQAAGRAAERSAYQLAATYLTRAHEIAAELPEAETPEGDAVARLRLEILLGRYVLELYSGDYERMSALLDQAEPLARRLGDVRRQTRILALRVHVFNILGQLETAIDLAAKARASAEMAGEASLLLWSAMFLGQTYFNAGRLAEADATLTENLDRIAGMNLPVDPAGYAPPEEATGGMNHGTAVTAGCSSFGTRAMARAMRGDFAGGRADIEEALALAARTARPYDHILVHSMRGFVELWARDGETAKNAFRIALDASEESGIGQLKPAALPGLGQALLLLGDIDAAHEILLAGYRLSKAQHRTMYQVVAASGLAMVFLDRHETDQALAYADEAVALAVQGGFDGVRVHALRAQGLVLAAIAGRRGEGLRSLEASLELAERCGMMADIAHGHAALAVAGAADRRRHLDLAGSRHAGVGLEAWWLRLIGAIDAGLPVYL